MATPDSVILMLTPDLPVADEWRRATATCAPVVPVRLAEGPRSGRVARPDADGVITLPRPRLRPQRVRVGARQRLEADVLVGLIDELAAGGTQVALAHAHFASASGGLPLLRARRDIPYVISEHSSALTFANPHKQISRAGIRAAATVYQAADAVLPVSDALGRAMVRRSLVATDRLTVVPNPIDTGRFHPAPERVGERRVVTAARLVPVKRLDLLIDAVAEASRRSGPIWLDIVGDGPERDRLVRRARAHGIGARVTFHGQLNRTGVATALRGARVFASTSHTENMPVAALEALASGLPVVAPAVGGFPEILRHAPGELFTTADATAVATALIRQLDADEDVVAAARSAAVNHYSIETIGERLDSIYDAVQRRRVSPVARRVAKG